jgi:hypothetical protein
MADKNAYESQLDFLKNYILNLSPKDALDILYQMSLPAGHKNLFAGNAILDSSEEGRSLAKVAGDLREPEDITYPPEYFNRPQYNPFIAENLAPLLYDNSLRPSGWEPAASPTTYDLTSAIGNLAFVGMNDYLKNRK